MENKVEIYTTTSCAFCKMAKQYFKENNIQYTEYNVGVGGDQAKAQEIFEKTQQYGVPVIAINGKIIIGFDKDKINEVLGI